MTRAERETVIVANLADLDEGWFSVETTEKGTYERLCRLVGDRLKVEIHKSSLTGQITTWECRVPAEFWGGKLLHVRKPREKRPISDQQKEMMSQRGFALGARRRGIKGQPTPVPSSSPTPE